MIHKFLKVLKESKNVAIITHTNPDGDAFGSSLMMYEFLSLNFLNVKKTILLDSPIPENFKPMFKDVNVKIAEDNYDCVIAVDCGDANRFPAFKTVFKNATHTISFDHHPNNPNFAEINFLDLTSSNCENIFNVFKQTKLKINTQLLKYCYVGMLTDTKNFTINSVTEKTHEVISEIMKSGVNTHEIYNCIYESREKAVYNLLGKAIKNTKFFLKDKVMISKLSSRDFKKCKLSENDTHGIIGELFQVKNCLACFLITPRNKAFHISMRSKQGIDVSIIAKKLGGGGHLCASACDTNLSLKTLKNQLLKEITPQIEAYKPVCNNIFDR